MYDAFISYSQRSDRNLAINLQRTLQRLGKRWNALRSSRVFRDEANLSASNALWSSLVAVLEKSEFLIVVCSPAAAISPWVNKEIEWWLKHRGAETLLLVLADGDLIWDAEKRNFQDGEKSAAPHALLGAISDEPFWVDLRTWRNKRFASRQFAFQDRTAALAATIQRRPKEELLSEELRARRRMVLGLGVVSLVILGLGTGILLARIEQRRLAEAEAAQRNLAIVQQSSERASQAAAAVNAGDGLSGAILTLQALPKNLNGLIPFAETALAGLINHHSTMRLATIARTPSAIYAPLAISQKDGWYATGTETGLVVFDLETHIERNRLHLDAQNSLTIAWSDAARLFAARGPGDEDEDDTQTGLFRRDGVLHCELRRAATPTRLKFSDDGQYVFVGTHGGAVRKYQTSDCSQVAFFREVSGEVRTLEFFQLDGEMQIAVGYLNGTLIILDEDLDLLRQEVVQGRLLDIATDRDGSWIARAPNPGVIEIITADASARMLDAGGGNVFGLEVSPSGNFLAVSAGEDGAISIWHTKDWSRVARITVGARVGVYDLSFVTDDRLFAFEGLEGRLYDIRLPDRVLSASFPEADYPSPSLFGVESESETEVTFKAWGTDGPRDYWTADVETGAASRLPGTTAITVGGASLAVDSNMETVTSTSEGRTHSITFENPVFRMDATASGKFALVATMPENGPLKLHVLSFSDGAPNVIWTRDLEGGEGEVEYELHPLEDQVALRHEQVSVQLVELASNTTLRRLDGALSDVTDLAFYADGSRLAATSYDGRVHVWSISDGALMFATPRVEEQLFAVTISPDMRLLAAGGYNGSLRLFDARSGTLLLTEEELFRGPVTGVDFTPNGAFLFAATNGDAVHRLAIGSTGQTARDWMEITLPRQVESSYQGELEFAGLIVDDLQLCRELAATLDMSSVVPGGGVIPSRNYAGARQVCERAVMMSDDPCLRFSLARMLQHDRQFERSRTEMKLAADNGCRAASIALAEAARNSAIGPISQTNAREQSLQTAGDVAEVFRLLARFSNTSDQFMRRSLTSRALQLDVSSTPQAQIAVALMREGADPDDHDALLDALRLYDIAIRKIESEGTALQQQLISIEIAYERRAALAWFLGKDVLADLRDGSESRPELNAEVD